jgi:hypothetical protein|uniref:Uncharacterized protein n=1 Tax=Mimiviridae sp. ChoanoV1 TaxID=2596887 RepID=A0A5B8IE80_9VIRU|nr:hypothetical protein 5_33 [Mimiviridae sp. ChoanoV1]
MFYFFLFIILSSLYIIFLKTNKKEHFTNNKKEHFTNNKNNTIYNCDNTLEPSLPPETDIDLIKFNLIEINNNFTDILNREDWKYDFDETYCSVEDDLSPSTSFSGELKKSCSCLNICDKKICGVEFEKFIYECPSFCGSCKKCHENNNSDICKNNKKCKDYYQKYIYFKSDNVNQKIKNKKVINYDIKIFIPKFIPFYYVNDDIIIELLFSKENTLNIKKVFIGEKEYKHNLFLKDKDKILLYIETFSKINNQDLIIELEVKGKPLVLKKKISIVEKSTFYDEETKVNNSIKNKEIVSSLEDDFAYNYLKNSNLDYSNLNNNPKVINDIKYLELGEMKERKEFKVDNPLTWKDRMDINRPWFNIFTDNKQY